MADADFADLIQQIKDTYSVNESEIARRIDVSAAAVNSWVHKRRVAPRRETLERIAEAFPKLGRDQVFAAAERRTPGILTDDMVGQFLALFADLTAEQQQIVTIQVQALAQHNQRNRPL